MLISIFEMLSGNLKELYYTIQLRTVMFAFHKPEQLSGRLGHFLQICEQIDVTRRNAHFLPYPVPVCIHSP